MNTGSYIVKNVGMHIKLNDFALFLFFNRKLECRLMDILMLLFTFLGSLPFTVALSAGVLLFNIPALSNLGATMVATIIIGQLCVQAVKRLVNRPRPYTVSAQAHPKNPPSCAYSFPSGHTCAAFCIALTLAQCIPSLAFPAYTVASLVGVSRVYMGLHYPSDVLCGYAVAYLAYWLQTIV